MVLGSSSGSSDHSLVDPDPYMDPDPYRVYRYPSVPPSIPPSLVASSRGSRSSDGSKSLKAESVLRSRMRDIFWSAPINDGSGSSTFFLKALLKHLILLSAFTSFQYKKKNFVSTC